MGENFPEGTSQSDPSAVPRIDDPDSLGPAAPQDDEEDRPSETEHPAGDKNVEDEPENQQTG